MANRGLSSPVLVPESIDPERDYSATTVEHLLAMTDEELAAVDPVAMNLIVAKGIPALANVNIAEYQDLVNAWVLDLRDRCLPAWEPHFYHAPDDFKNDIRYFRLGMVCQYLDLEVGIQYHPDQREITEIRYLDPSHLFLNGVINSRLGTCGSMAALQMAIGWRMGWPVSLACVNAHYLLRFDDGETTYNIETTQSGYGGFKSDPDEFLIREQRLPQIAIESGSDLRALRPRELLGAFIALRARHLQDTGKDQGNTDLILASEADWLLARHLFPTNRVIYRNQIVVAAMRGEQLFDPIEAGHPKSYPQLLHEMNRLKLPRKPSELRVSTSVPSLQSLESLDQIFASIEADL